MNGFFARFGAFFLLACPFVGCGLSTAPCKDLTLLRPDVPRELIVREFGRPLITVDDSSGPTDVYGFYQGYAGSDRYFRTGLGGGELEIEYEADIAVKPEEFSEKEPTDKALYNEWWRRKWEYDQRESSRVAAINAEHAEEIAAQKKRRAEAPKLAREKRDHQLAALAHDQIPGFPDLVLSNPYERPNSAGVIVVAVTYDETARAKFLDIAQGEKLVDEARKKSGSWFAKEPLPLPQSGFFQNRSQQAQEIVRLPALSEVNEAN